MERKPEKTGIGSVVALLAVIACGMPVMACAIEGDPSGFPGYWTNEDPDTGNIIHVEIRTAGDLLLVHMWGRCHPQDCDWGEQSTPISDADDGLLSITWNPGFKIERQELSVLADGRLKIAGSVHYTDSSGRMDRWYTDYFSRQQGG